MKKVSVPIVPCGRAHRATAFLLMLLTLMFLTVPALVSAAPPKQEPMQVPSLDNGIVLWAQNCAPCHGVSGKGDGPTIAAMDNVSIPDFTDPEAAKTRAPADMFTTIREGRMDKLMPPWKDRLSDEQIWDVAAYAQSLSASATDLEAGRAVFAENCAECHGEDGAAAEGIDLSDPTALAAKTRQALFNTLRAAKGNHAALAGLSDVALWQSLAVARTFSLKMLTSPQLNGIFSGQIINGSTGQPVPDVPLTLYVLDSNGQTLETREGSSDAQGNFTFKNLDRSHTRTYGLEASYLGISYFSQEPVVFLPDEDRAAQNITVYETTQDASTVSQGTFHRIISFGVDAMSVADVYVFSNSGDRTFVGELQADGTPATVKIALPAEATEINFRSKTVREVEDGVYLGGEPVPPGQESYTLFVSYLIPFSEDRISVKTPLFYNVAGLNVLASDQGQSIESAQLEFNGVQSIQGSDFQIWAGSGLKAGQTFEMTFADLDKIEVPSAAGESAVSQRAGATVFNQNIALWSALVLGLLAMVFAIFFLGRPQPQPETAGGLPAERDRLLIMLKELDRLKQDGELDDAQYRQLQQNYRNSLKHLLAQRHD